MGVKSASVSGGGHEPPHGLPIHRVGYRHSARCRHVRVDEVVAMTRAIHTLAEAVSLILFLGVLLIVARLVAG